MLSQPPDRPGYRAVVTCHNGQTVSTVSGGQRLAVTAVEPVVTQSADTAHKIAFGYRPTISVIHEGAALQVTPIANTSGKFVVLDVHTRVGQLRPRGDDEPPEVDDDEDESMSLHGAPTPREVASVIDRSILVSQRLSTTLRVPTDRPILIGGMTFDSQPDDDAASLYLFVVVSVQELRDDQPASAPAGGDARVPPPVVETAPEGLPKDAPEDEER
jgi:hypothetical protein